MPIYFGLKIRNARKAAGLTQRQLADKIGVSHTSVSNWEKDLSRPDPDTIENLCWVLGVQPNYFFSMDDTASPKLLSSTAPLPAANQAPADSDRNVLRLAGRDGSYLERVLSDQQLDLIKHMLSQLPDASDDL